jgi:multidrug resistance efflux pump
MTAVLKHERGLLVPSITRLARSVVSRIPAGVVMGASLGLAWLLLGSNSRHSQPPATACLHVVAPQQGGRIAWVVDAAHGEVRKGDIVVKLEGREESAPVRSHVGGAVRAVLKKHGDEVAAGDPVVIVGPSAGATCP